MVEFEHNIIDELGLTKDRDGLQFEKLGFANTARH